MNKKTIELVKERNNNLFFIKLILFSLVFLLFAMQNIAKAAEEDFSSETDLEQQIEPEFNSALSQFRQLIGIEELPEDTIALVDGSPITLRDVEELANLNYISRNDEETLTIDYVLEEYSVYLFELIEQKIVSREIEEQSITVPYSDVEEIENIIRESYAGFFEQELENEGIDIDLWRDQIKKRLEKEAMQLTIISQIRISPQEILNYQETNSHLFEIPEKYHVLMISSNSQADLQKIYKKKITAIEQVDEFSNVSAQSGVFTKTNLPEEWEEDIAYMEKNKKTRINHSANTYKYLVLLEDIPASTKSQEEIFVQVEQQLREAKADRAYSQWLIDALNETDIEIIPQFASILRADSENSASGLIILDTENN